MVSAIAAYENIKDMVALRCFFLLPTLSSRFLKTSPDGNVTGSCSWRLFCILGVFPENLCEFRC